jgi:16S rRNA G966 N2-methylase RsmD
MSVHNDSLLQRRPEFTVELSRGGSVKLVHEMARFTGDHQTLRILDAFDKPTKLAQAIDTLSALTANVAAFTDVFDQILALVKLGFLVEAGSMTDTLALGSDAGAFESLPIHIRMLADTARTHAFQDAIRKTVKPGDVVLDIGTGSGILAATAALAGARHVYAIERTGIASLAQQVFDANGLKERVTLLRGSSLQLELPEKADVLVCELLGNDPLQEDVRRTTTDAIARLLKPSARILPERIRMLALPLSLPQDFVEEARVLPAMVAHWRSLYGVDLTPLQKASEQQDHRLNATTYAARDWPRLTAPVHLADIDLRDDDGEGPDVCHQVPVTRSGPLTGILVYFEILLGAAGWFSIAPDEANETNHWSSFIWTPGKTLDVSAGDLLDLRYRYRNGQSSFDVTRMSG